MSAPIVLPFAFFLFPSPLYRFQIDAGENDSYDITNHMDYYASSPSMLAFQQPTTTYRHYLYIVAIGIQTNVLLQVNVLLASCSRKICMQVSILSLSYSF
jgi:hypothetical protein